MEIIIAVVMMVAVVVMVEVCFLLRHDRTRVFAAKPCSLVGRGALSADPPRYVTPM